MESKSYRVIERPLGAGEIRKGGEHLADVFYRLQVIQCITLIESSNRKVEIPGQIEISGQLHVKEANGMHFKVMQGISPGGLLTLHLSDGRRLDVYVIKSDSTKGIYRIVCGSSRGFVSD